MSGSGSPAPAAPDAVVRCNACAFWDHVNDRVGHCRRVAPVPRRRPDEVTHWAMTGPLQGCGDGLAATVGGSLLTRCGRCRFWQPNPGGGLNPQDRGDERMSWWRSAGHCLRHAPLPSPDTGNRGFWCATHRDDGCGEGLPATPPAP